MFNSINSGKYKVSGKIVSDIIESEMLVKFYLNDEVVYTYNINSNKDENYQFNILLSSGKNQIKALISSSSVFNINNISVNIEIQSDGTRNGNMSSCTISEKEYILFVSDNLGKVYLVDNQTIVPVLVYTFNCSSGVILSCDTEKITIICSSTSGRLQEVNIFINDFSSVTTELGYGGVSSVACIKSGDSYKVLFTRFGEVFSANYNSSGSFVAEKTGKKGSLVYGENNINGLYIVVDQTKKTKLILE